MLNVASSTESDIIAKTKELTNNFSSASMTTTIQDDSGEATSVDPDYQRGLATIAFITLLFSSNSPVIHMAFVNSSTPPPVLLLNAATSSIALFTLIAFGPLLNSLVPLPKALDAKNVDVDGDNFNPMNIKAGTELGLWKTLGTTANLYGLSLTSANHGAFLIQLTTLIVPAVQGMMGVPIPKRIWTAIGLALMGITLFTQDAVSAGSADIMASNALLGDALCAVAAGFYATYDLRLFDYGKKVPPLPLIRTKIAVQALLSVGILTLATDGGGLNGAMEYLEGLLSSPDDAMMIGGAALWSGMAINAVAPFMQVYGQQTIGASRAQVVYASQPLWASLLSWIMLKETLGTDGMMGGSLFLVAIALAATAESPDPNCEVDNNCEV